MSDLTIEQACELMHDAYEEAASEAGWETNPASRKAWADVPEANKVTMRAAVGALLKALGHDIPPEPESGMVLLSGSLMVRSKIDGSWSEFDSWAELVAYASSVGWELRYVGDVIVGGNDE